MFLTSAVKCSPARLGLNQNRKVLSVLWTTSSDCRHRRVLDRSSFSKVVVLDVGSHHDKLLGPGSRLWSFEHISILSPCDPATRRSEDVTSQTISLCIAEFISANFVRPDNISERLFAFVCVFVCSLRPAGESVGGVSLQSYTADRQPGTHSDPLQIHLNLFHTQAN